MLNCVDYGQNRQFSPLARVKKIRGLAGVLDYLKINQAALARRIQVDPAVISKTLRQPKKYKLSPEQVERVAIEVARQFRNETQAAGRLWGLRYHYNSPLVFEAWGVCRQHRVEYRIHRMTDNCPRCKK